MLTVLFPLGTLRTIWTHEGIRGLYRGLAPTIYGYLPTWAIYFTVGSLAPPVPMSPALADFPCSCLGVRPREGSFSGKAGQ